MDDRGLEGEVHAPSGLVILTRGGNPLELHICGKNHYKNKPPKKDKSNTPTTCQKHRIRHQSTSTFVNIGETNQIIHV